MSPLYKPAETSSRLMARLRDSVLMITKVPKEPFSPER